MWRDLQTNALIDAIVQYPKASPYWPNGGSPQLYGSPSLGAMKLNVTGPPGTSVTTGVVMQFPNPGRTPNELKLDANVTIPAGGTITASAHNNGNTVEPVGPITFHPSTPVPGVTVTYVAGSFTAGSGIGTEGAHMPAMAYLPFLLTGDPYFLETLQAQAMFHIMEVPQGAGIPDLPQMRAVAWMLRSLMQAATVTPATVPSWLLPQAPFKTKLDQVRTAMTARTTDGSPGRFVHTMDNPGSATVAFWQADFLTAVTAWTTLLHPEWRPLLDWMLGCQQGRTRSDLGMVRRVSVLALDENGRDHLGYAVGSESIGLWRDRLSDARRNAHEEHELRLFLGADGGAAAVGASRIDAGGRLAEHDRGAVAERTDQAARLHRVQVVHCLAVIESQLYSP